MPRKKVDKPMLQQWGDSSHEEKPYSPSWSPETTSRTLDRIKLTMQQLVTSYAWFSLSLSFFIPPPHI